MEEYNKEFFKEAPAETSLEEITAFLIKTIMRIKNIKQNQLKIKGSKSVLSMQINGIRMMSLSRIHEVCTAVEIETHEVIEVAGKIKKGAYF